MAKPTRNPKAKIKITQKSKLAWTDVLSNFSSLLNSFPLKLYKHMGLGVNVYKVRYDKQTKICEKPIIGAPQLM